MRRAVIALAALAIAGHARAAEITAARTPDGRLALKISGEIVEHDDASFDGALSMWPNARTVILDSPGGRILPALAIGRQIGGRHLATMVLPGDTCASACADIWLGAQHRYLSPGAHLGFHGAYGNDGKTLEMTGAGKGLIGACLARLGYSDDVVLLVTAAQPNEMVWIDPAQPLGPMGLTFEPGPHHSTLEGSVGGAGPGPVTHRGVTAAE